MAKNKDISEIPNSDIEEGYLTLKEASELSEYSPDYIGQLIRAGKIEGKQVYSNVAWVTTEKSLRAYMSNKGKELPLSSHQDVVGTVPDYFRPLLYTIIVCGSLFLLILIHIFSVSLDRAISSSFEKNATSEVGNI